MRVPRDHNPDARVRPARDAKHGKVAGVGVVRDDNDDQVADRAEEAGAGDNETAGLETVCKVGGAAEDEGGDGVGRDGEELGERVGCTNQSMFTPAIKRARKTYYSQRW